MSSVQLKKMLSIGLFETSYDGRQPYVPYIVGEKGDGKSTIVKEVCQENNAYLIDIRLALEDVPDLKGFPMVEEKAFANGETIHVTSFATPDWIPHGPKLEEIKAKGFDHIVIFFDEMARAKMDVHQVIFRMVLDFSHGDIVFDKMVRFCAADNPATKDYKGVNKLDSALLDRFLTIRYQGPTLQEWISYEQESGQCDPLILRFMREQSNLYRKGSATPRTLSSIGRRILTSSVKDDEDIFFHVIEGKVDTVFATAFTKYCQSSYESLKAKTLFECGNAEFAKHLATLESWNTEDGKMSDSILDTSADIMDFFRDSDNYIVYTQKRMLKVINAMPEDRAFMMLREFALGRQQNVEGYIKIASKLNQHPDVKAMLQRMQEKMGEKV